MQPPEQIPPFHAVSMVVTPTARAKSAGLKPPKAAQNEMPAQARASKGTAESPCVSWKTAVQLLPHPVHPEAA